MALRKLQAEIDRTLKTVAQGVELFESTFDKLNHASNTTQKDKSEQDLKTQIKKLQRLRDQIKVWLGSSDIKDKSALLENRKLIETQMERFKALEKEMKMKAFSKEGLIAAARLDPAEKAKRDTIDWIGTTTDELSRQIEQTEAEAETLQATGKKKKQAGDRLGELETLNERRTWHIGRLEVVQRMLENGQLTVEQVESVQEDVKYFVEANTEEDFDFDAGMYDDLNLQDEDVDYMQDYAQTDELSNLDTSSVTDGGDVPKTPAKDDKRSTSTSKTTVDDTTSHPSSPVAARKVPLKKPTMESVKVEAVKTPTKPIETPPAAPASVPKAAPLPPIRYAAAAAAAVASVPPTQSVTSPSSSAIPPPAPAVVPAPPAEVAAPPPKVESPAAVSETVPEHEAVQSPTPVPAVVPKTEASQSNGHPPPPPPGLGAPPSQPVPTPPASYQQIQPATNGTSTAPLSTNPQSLPPPPGYVPHAESSRAGASYGGSSAGGAATAASPRKEQGVLGNLIHSFDMAKELSERRANDVNELHSALDISYQNAPQQIDAEPPRYYHPRNPVATPSYYPQHKLATLEDKSIYSRLDLDQLFYIFYYMTGTYEQWLAAQELKRQSWRFHKQYLTWFQRAHNPQAITEDYEQGGYFYFDWENSWCQRKKSDFRFEYRWLSDH